MTWTSDRCATVVRKTFKSYAPSFIQVDIKYLPMRPRDTICLWPGSRPPDRPPPALGPFTHLQRSERRQQHRFLRHSHAAAPMKIAKLLTDNGNLFTDRFTLKAKELTCKRSFERRCALLDI
ncbi:hypothetical protein [Rhodanobacter sp. A1T4]|uniref:hypothetical protein n=1 Tax=Rhodanobacter sp. A1T4 TaxID=2723087 RepID=UPI00160F1AB9|nr:hypothetical protein [Rhodanobacter sp. A1T4]MBB6249446.1 hypothetical protein [Rhodanobacter sp. A1T4]